MRYKFTILTFSQNCQPDLTAIRTYCMNCREIVLELCDINSQLQVYITQFWLYISQFWLYISQIWLYISQIWLYDSQLRVYIRIASHKVIIARYKVRIARYKFYKITILTFFSQFWLFSRNFDFFQLRVKVQIWGGKKTDMFLELRVYISQFWEKKSELWDINSQLWEKKVAVTTFFIFYSVADTGFHNDYYSGHKCQWLYICW